MFGIMAFLKLVNTNGKIHTVESEYNTVLERRIGCILDTVLEDTEYMYLNRILDTFSGIFEV